MNGDQPLRILRFSTLYPNAAQTRHGVFTEENLRHLLTDCAGEVTATVLAPVPWFPWAHPRFGRYATFAAVPREETRQGVRVLHPRYPVLPKVGMSVAPWLMARAVLPFLNRMISNGEDFDLIDAHYFYPDGVAAVWLGERLHKPVVVTALGSDLNWIASYRLPRRHMQWAAANAQGLVSVSRALGDRFLPLGISREKIRVLRNGVDLDLFRPQPEKGAALRQELNLDGPVLLSVGNLIELKGHHIVIDAMQSLPSATLLIVGEGPMEAALRERAAAAGLQSRVRVLGPIPHRELPHYYNAVDLLVLASSREGMPNVVLEALACGTPVVACDVGGVREVVAEPVAGCVVESRNAAGVASAVLDVLARRPGRQAVSDYAQRFSWEDTSHGQLDLFKDVVRTYGEER